jgi:Co/Zn/Cd efflux system component
MSTGVVPPSPNGGSPVLKKKSMSREWRLIILSSFTFTYFLVELIVGYAAGSIALIADSFHMV